jgi:hypothetical protein
VISQQGLYRTYQHENKLIMLARPNAEFLSKKKDEIKSVQCTAALFNFEDPASTWEIFVDDRKVEGLGATARFGQVITIHDGVSYLAIRALATDDLGRDCEVILEPGVAQEPAHHGNTRIEPALLINAYLYRSESAIGEGAMKQLDSARTGFVVEMGDEKQYGSFGDFQAHMRKAKMNSDVDRVSYKSGEDTMTASWGSFTVNGEDPYAYAQERDLWQDTTLTQMGRGRLEKNGAVIERVRSWANMFLQTLPRQKIYVAMNLLPNYLSYSFREPGGVRIVADGACSMGRWAVKDSREIDIRYHAFGGEYLPKEKDARPATCLFITGTKGKPNVTLNTEDVTSMLKPRTQNGVSGWLVALNGGFPTDEEIDIRLTATRARSKRW